MYKNINMQKVVIWLFGIMIVSFLIAGSVLKAEGGIKGSIFTPRNGTASEGNLPLGQQDVNEEKVFALSGIKEIAANAVSTDIKVIPVDSNEIKVHFYGRVSVRANGSDPELVAEERNGRLVIEVKHRPVIGINLGNGKHNLDVYVPKSFTGSMSLGTVSGDAEIEGLTLDRLDSHSVSGDLKVSSVNASEIKLSTTSGNGKLGDSSGKLEFNSVSGDLDGELNQLKGGVKISTVSGEAKLKIPQNSDFSVDFNSVSGSFKSDFTIGTKGSQDKRNFKGTFGSGTHSINFNSTSGDFEIRS